MCVTFRASQTVIGNCCHGLGGAYRGVAMSRALMGQYMQSLAIKNLIPVIDYTGEFLPV
jgi:hypothetical protein